MKKLKVNLKYCYGIGSLDHEFDFSDKKVFSIYASNGTMKTSFAKTFMDVSKEKDSKDLIYTTRETVNEIKKDDIKLSKEEVFVVEPYNAKYESDRMSLLLVNEELKKKFDAESKDIEDKKRGFLEKINELSGLKAKEIEKEVCEVFHQSEEGKFFESLLMIKNVVQRQTTNNYKDIKYSEIFNEKTNKLLGDKAFREAISKYVENYNKLLEKSEFFKKGIFNHTQASTIAAELEKNGFFAAEHSLLLRNNPEKVTNKQELEKVIDDEKKQILSDENVKKVFEKVDANLKKNADLRQFRKYLSDNPSIVAELGNIVSFKAKLWKSYFKYYETNFNDLIEKFEKVDETLSNIKKQAKKEKTDWYKVIDQFNDRFFVPFTIDVENQTDVMLNETPPTIIFKFGDEKIEKEKLLQVLSQGERRALYILNILFEIEIRKKQNEECLLVIDDIADSFDYKNKYAIIEYLNEISKHEKFYLIILSHNFDFYRTITSRLDAGRKNKLHVEKHDTKIKLIEERYQNNPFIYWKKNLGNNKLLLASIPFVRNLFEYCGKDDEFEKMTEFLHIRKSINNLKVGQLKDLYESLLKVDAKKIQDCTKNYTELLKEICTEIVEENIENYELEDKVVLSIAIRLEAEKFMYSKIGDEITENKKRTTGKLFEEFKNKFPNNENIKILEQVNIMTPENIHLNSFMYEPILDMSGDSLQQLYQKITTINNSDG